MYIGVILLFEFQLLSQLVFCTFLSVIKRYHREALFAIRRIAKEKCSVLAKKEKLLRHTGKALQSPSARYKIKVLRGIFSAARCRKGAFFAASLLGGSPSFFWRFV
ncbi:MAG: hypothetical protein MJ135_07535, partial [Oscillospiraceae bacterium]|nr:hypothetical protein [Oscillospiraceae bacterium]